MYAAVVVEVEQRGSPPLHAGPQDISESPGVIAPGLSKASCGTFHIART